MTRRAAPFVVVAATFALPSTASAATVAVLPAKPCYRSGEEVGVGGTGFTPNGGVRITSDGNQIGALATDPQGAFRGVLTVGQRDGERVKTYAATDQANPALTASTPLKVSALDVSVHPHSGRPGKRLKVNARGFTSDKNLYAHVVRGRSRKSVKLGRLRGDCGEFSKRKRVLSRGTGPGNYTVQFDGKHKYSKKTKVRVRFRVFVLRKFSRRSAASAAAVRWTRLP